MIWSWQKKLVRTRNEARKGKSFPLRTSLSSFSISETVFRGWGEPDLQYKLFSFLRNYFNRWKHGMCNSWWDQLFVCPRFCLKDQFTSFT
jgi:hypothetical protein